MKAIQLTEPLNFKHIDIEEPDSPGEGDALVRVHRMGICGTDLSGYLGKMPFFSYPRIPGHELGVEVLAVGAGVTNVKSGDRCSIEPYINDPASFASNRKGTNCCEHLQVLGVHVDGGLRERFVVPARKLHVSTKLEYDQLALVETLAIGCHAVDRAKPAKGEHLLVIGAGPIGLSVIEFARLAGAEVTVLDMNEKRLAFCRDTMGVAHTVQFRGDGSEGSALSELTGGHMYPIVIDATGSAQSMSDALNYVAHTGSLVYVGITTQEIHFPHPRLHVREASILASRNAHPEDFGRIIRLIETGQIDTKPWITHRIGFQDMISAFPSYTKPETGVIKAIVEVT
ncbi:MAG: zinc-binding alcohol dehydrogenase family protein [Planctomycetales bacterium]|nr:zinc-binding alcohol dehydrogenase family protein [Planctomycetales bacterium]